MEKGTIIKLDYDLYVLEDSEERLVETTDKEKAKEAGIYDPNFRYGPRYTVLGEGAILEAVEEALLSMEVGEEREIVLEPERAFGPRRPELVKIHSYRELARRDIEPEVGKEVVIDGKRGKILSVTPGRVLVDYNHPLAGKTLKYRLRIVEKVEEPSEVVKAVLEMEHGTSEGFEVEVSEEGVEIRVPERERLSQGWIIDKFRVISSLKKLLKPKRVRIVEEYVLEEAKESQASSEPQEKSDQGTKEDQTSAQP
ncbi:MAG: peptidylprolyl isomerase [Thermoplasmata archaeon]|nr:MAG: peptidylprolyl isomerase [Thermoplasmata archaeon]